MLYYQIAVLNSSLKPLTYSFSTQILPYTLVKISIRNSVKIGVVIKICEKPDFQTKEILEVLDLKFTEIQINLANFISSYYICDLGVSFGLFTPYKSSNLISQVFTKSPNLSPKQTKCLEFVKDNNTSLIFGDTGSGKSEIYISFIKDQLNAGKQALFLMPEISLTPQMQSRLENYFGSSLGVWHSKITPKNKMELLAKFESGEIKLIAGARSALFLPYINLGVIIVDEEHDDSYKSSSKPRYNARDLALYISNKFKIKTILGSATPALTTHQKHPTFRLKGTYFKSDKEILYDENETKITPMLERELRSCLNNAKQAIVFLPTRANFKYMICSKCSTIVSCPFCSVGMSFHKDKNSLKCHYCGYSTYSHTKCIKCQSQVMESKRMGTSEVVEQLNKLFPNANISKFDRDALSTQKKLISTLKEFNDHKTDILVGTQMLSKGHDYHNVALSIVMGIDANLGYADFRAREKTLSLAIQLAGRAGRAGKAKVIIQTQQTQFFKEYIEDYDKFLSDELKFREGLYPPFTRLLRLLISNKKEDLAKRSMQKCLLSLKKISNIDIIGYGKANIEYISSKFRYEILIRSDNPKALIKAGFACYNIPNVEVDMDAINFT
ncbi:MAG: primosomal protein N' [Campylobacter sp.]|nr:primosomal protein N' [Campylobacter sp.]